MTLENVCGAQRRSPYNAGNDQGGCDDPKISDIEYTSVQKQDSYSDKRDGEEVGDHRSEQHLENMSRHIIGRGYMVPYLEEDGHLVVGEVDL